VTFSEALREIESLDFSVRLNIASGLRTFLDIANQEEAVLVVRDRIRSTTRYWQLVRRTVDLLREEFDEQYENPADTALAVYTWLLNESRLETRRAPIAEQVTDQVARARQCWWALKVAEMAQSSHPRDKAVSTDRFLQDALLARWFATEAKDIYLERYRRRVDGLFAASFNQMGDTNGCPWVAHMVPSAQTSSGRGEAAPDERLDPDGSVPGPISADTHVNNLYLTAWDATSGVRKHSSTL